MIHAFIPGTPIPQGSVNSYGGRIVGVTPKLREWRNKVRTATMAKHEGPPLDGPITVHMVFQMPRPKKPRWALPAVTVEKINDEIDASIKAATDKINAEFTPVVFEAQSVLYEVMAAACRIGFTYKELREVMDCDRH